VGAWRDGHGGGPFYSRGQLGRDDSSAMWCLPALGAVERGAHALLRTASWQQGRAAVASCAWSAHRGDCSQGHCLHTLVLSDVSARFCSAGHMRWACAKRQATKVPSTEETRREGVGLAWLLAHGCLDEACRHAARPEHHSAAAAGQRGSDRR
jgi:hypothetical protein